MSLQGYDVAYLASITEELSYNESTCEVFFKKVYDVNSMEAAKCIGITQPDSSIFPDIYRVHINDISRESLWKFMRYAHMPYLQSNIKVLQDDFFVKLGAAYKKRDEMIESMCRDNYEKYDKLMFHQKESAIEGFYKQKFVLALEQGLGKTLASIARSFFLKKKKTLVVCPAVAKYNWVDELYEWGCAISDITVVDKEKTRVSSTELFIVINYDVLDKWLPILKSKEIDHIILDECHKVKNVKSIRNKVINEISRAKKPTITFLSGTPASNNVEDIFAYLELSEHPLGSDKSLFLKKFTQQVRLKNGDVKTIGANLEHLNICISNLFFRRRKDVLSLPGKKYHKLYFDIGEYKQEYDKALDEMIERMMEKGKKNLELSISQLGVITSKSKAKGVISLAETISDELQDVIVSDSFIENGVKTVIKNKKISVKNKVIIFSPYIAGLDILEKHFKNRCVRIDGAVPSKKRMELAKRFKTSRTVNFLIAQTDAAGIAINIVNKEDDKHLPPIFNVIHMGFPFTNSQLEQANDRVDRIGQWVQCNIYYTFAKKTIDEKIFNLIERKYDDVSVVIDGEKEKINFEDINLSEIDMIATSIYEDAIKERELSENNTETWLN